MPRHLIVPTAIVSAVVVAVLAQGCTDIGPDEPEPTANHADRAFVNAMIRHHQSTIALARPPATRNAGPFVRRLGRRIVSRRTAELGRFIAREQSLHIAGAARAAMPPIGGTEDPATARRQLMRLRRVDAFEPAFVDAMIRHQRHVVDMSRFVLKRGRDAEVERAARRILRNRQRPLGAMRRFVDGG